MNKIKLLQPLMWVDKAWAEKKVPQAQKTAILLLSLIYFCQLFLIKLIDTKTFFCIEQSYHAKNCQFLGTIIGGLVAAYILNYRRKKDKRNALKLLLNIFNIGLGVSIIVYIIFYSSFHSSLEDLDTDIFDTLLNFIRFFIGFFNSAFIGFSIIWLVESPFRHLRTSGALYIGFWGFMGATIASIFEKQEQGVFISLTNVSPSSRFSYGVDCYFLFVPLVMIIISIVIWKTNILNEAKLVNEFYKKEKSDKQKSQQKPTSLVNTIKKLVKFFSYEKFESPIFTLGLFSLLLGMTVQYWVFIAAHSKNLFNIIDKGTFWRYLGATIGCLGTLWYFKNAKIRRRDNYLFRFLFFSFLLNIFFIKYYAHLDSIFFIFLFIFIGILSSIWIVAILHLSEQFDLKTRAFMLLLTPNVFRGSELILLWRTHTYNQEIWTSEQNTAVFLWGAMFSFLGLLAIRVLKRENFEGDALAAGVDEKGKIDDAKLLVEITGIKDDKVKIFFNDANKKLHEHFDSVFNLQCFLSAIYYKENDTINHSDYKTYNNVFGCYAALPEGKEYDIEAAHKISASLIAQKKHQSIIEYLWKDTALSGGLLYRPGRMNRVVKVKENDDKFNLKTYDLTTFKIDDIDQKLEELDKDNKAAFEIIKFERIDTKLKEIKNKDEENTEGLYQTLALFRIDAEAYCPECYYLYLIKPIAEDPRCMLVLKSAVELSLDNLVRLRNVIDKVQGQWDEVSQSQEYERKKALHFNSLHSHFVSNMVNGMAEFYKTETDEKLIGKVKGKTINLFKGYMSAKDPYIKISKEKELLESYLYVYITSKYHKMDEMQKKELRDYLNSGSSTKLPYKWEIEIDKDILDFEIPRCIIQPIVENALEPTHYSKFDNLELSVNISKIENTNNNLKIIVRNKISGKPDLDLIKGRISGTRVKENGEKSSLFYVNEAIEIHSKTLGPFINCSDGSNGYFEVSFDLINCNKVAQSKDDSESLCKRPIGTKKLSTMIVDDSELAEIKQFIASINKVALSLKIDEEVENYDNVEELIRDKNFDLIIADLALSENVKDKNKWSINILMNNKTKIIEGKTAIIIISNSDEQKDHIDKTMEGNFGALYLGFISKTDDVANQIDKYLNKHYCNNLKK